MNNEIQSGQPIYKVLAEEKIIPIMFTSMFRIGEETGELSEMVDKLADFYEDEVSTSVKSLTSILGKSTNMSSKGLNIFFIFSSSEEDFQFWNIS